MYKSARVYVIARSWTYEDNDTEAYHKSPGMLIPVAKAKARTKKRVVGNCVFSERLASLGDILLISAALRDKM